MNVSFLVNVGSALLLGAIIGLERQFQQHPAGLRTNALVCVGAALFVSLARLLGHEADLDHIAGQVVTGVGFLGGGVILREGMTVKGMNTAATLWCSAAVGVLSGAGFPLYGVLGAAAVLGVHLGLRPVGRWIDNHTRKAADVETSYRLHVVCERRQEAVVRTILMRHVGDHSAFTLQGIATQDAAQPDLAAVTADISSGSRNDRAMEELTNRLQIEPGIASVRWERAR